MCAGLCASTQDKFPSTETRRAGGGRNKRRHSEGEMKLEFQLVGGVQSEGHPCQLHHQGRPKRWVEFYFILALFGQKKSGRALKDRRIAS